MWFFVLKKYFSTSLGGGGGLTAVWVIPVSSGSRVRYQYDMSRAFCPHTFFLHTIRNPTVHPYFFTFLYISSLKCGVSFVNKKTHCKGKCVRYIPKLIMCTYFGPYLIPNLFQQIYQLVGYCPNLSQTLHKVFHTYQPFGLVDHLTLHMVSHSYPTELQVGGVDMSHKPGWIIL